MLTGFFPTYAIFLYITFLNVGALQTKLEELDQERDELEFERDTESEGGIAWYVLNPDDDGDLVAIAVFKDKDSVFITKRALAITVQENDSLYIHSDTLMVTGPADHRITRAFYNVKIFKSDLSGKSDSVHVDQNSGLTKMINLKRLQSSDAFKRKKKPILWNLGNQMTGDTIHFISEKETKFLDSLIVFNNAFLISKDTLGDGFNQIKGQKLIGLLEENELKNVHIIKNAEVIYYFRNSDNLLEGINKSKSGKDEIFSLMEVNCLISPISTSPSVL